MNLIIGFIAGMIFAYIYENLPFYKFTGKKALIISGYRLHHSLYGLLLVLIAFMNILPINNLILISAGFGIIIEHYLTGGGLDFITQEK
jgi:hypothetical protein